MGFCLGYAELATEGGRVHRYNTTILVDATARSSAATARCTCRATRTTSRGGRSSTSSGATSRSAPTASGVCGRSAGVGIVGMAICNDRRWPETYRVMGLQGVELILIGYNTPIHYPPAPEQDALVALPQRTW